MRRTGVVLAVFMAVAAASVSGATRADFDRVVDFSVTLKTLAAVADGTAPFPGQRMLLLSGTVSSITILDKDRATFRARVEVITGEWFGTEEVKAYACYVDFTGADWFDTFPARAPAKPGPGVIVQSARILVAARALSIVSTPLGDKRVLLDGAYIRVIE